jgi:hypothetical protein
MDALLLTLRERSKPAFGTFNDFWRGRPWTGGKAMVFLPVEHRTIRDAIHARL